MVEFDVSETTVKERTKVGRKGDKDARDLYRIADAECMYQALFCDNYIIAIFVKRVKFVVLLGSW